MIVEYWCLIAQKSKLTGFFIMKISSKIPGLIRQHYWRAQYSIT